MVLHRPSGCEPAGWGFCQRPPLAGLREVCFDVAVELGFEVLFQEEDCGARSHGGEAV